MPQVQKRSTTCIYLYSNWSKVEDLSVKRIKRRLMNSQVKQAWAKAEELNGH